MKKNYFILGLIFLIAPFCSDAQVINGGFEDIKPNFLPRNWGMNFVYEFGFDMETGEQFGEQIQFTWCFPSMVYATTDAKSGQYAMEISNAYNWSKQILIPGSATLFSDPEQDSPGWNPGVPVSPGTSVVLLGFDYKFMPVEDDIAQAKLEIIDADGNQLGSASLDISGWNDNYVYVYTPVSITRAGTPAFMYISFNMAKAGSTPVFGSRLLVDNVIVNFSSLITEENEAKSAKIFPTLVDNELNIIPNGFSDNITYRIINSEGRVVKQNTVNQDSSSQYTMDANGLSSGVYFINIQDGTNNSTKKFIKK